MARFRSKWVVAAVPAVMALAMSTLGVSSPHSGASSVAGSAGTDVSLPATPSQMTLRGRGSFAGLAVTVNQTTHLANQAISVSWKGGPPTFSDPTTGFFNGTFAGNYLQVLQCWGDDDGSIPSNPGPPPQQCEFGGEATSISGYPVKSVFNPFERTISQAGWTCGTGSPPGCLSWTQAKQLATTDPRLAYLDPNVGVVSPFLAVDGTTVPVSVNYNYAAQIPYAPHDINPYFSHNTTNEIDFSRTYGDGTGQDLFQVDTGLEAPGLGCGEATQKGPDGVLSTPKCWIVVVPRGTPQQENMTGDPHPDEVDTSPLTPASWRNRIAFPLSFNPIATSCSIAANSRRVLGGEAAAPAIASWQPALCAKPGLPPFTYSPLPDDRARSLLTAPGSSGPGMIVVGRPLDRVPDQPDVAYAPVTLSGAVIGFNVQRQPQVGSDGQYLSDELPLAGKHITTLKLTPRLVAKLLTQSYVAQLYPGQVPPGYTWAAHNPQTVLDDPEFLQFNPEFAELRSSSPVETSGLVVEQQSSDAAGEVWRWILVDREAREWLAGKPDPSGMKVNPYYTLSSPAAPAAGFTPPSNFLKSDPWCWTPPSNFVVGNPPQLARNLCGQDWAPYVLNLRAAAVAARSTNTSAHTSYDPGAAQPSEAWVATGPQMVGKAFVLSLTDSAQAARYGLQTASLSRAGDDTPGRQFASASVAGIYAGAASMSNSSVAGVGLTNPAATTPGAYPLPLLSYAALIPANLTASARSDYSQFLDYAAGAGQHPGTDLGDLPPGYAPLPAPLAAQTRALAAAILHPPVPAVPTTAAPASSTGGIAAQPVLPSVPTAAADAAQSGGDVVTAASSDSAHGRAVGSGSSGPSRLRRAQPPRANGGTSTPGPAAPPDATPGVGDQLAAPAASRAPLLVPRTPAASRTAAFYVVPIATLLGLAAMILSLSGRLWRPSDGT